MISAGMTDDNAATTDLQLPTGPRRPKGPQVLGSSRFAEATSVISPAAAESPISESPRPPKREEVQKRESHFWRNVSWQFTLFASWRGWPVIREYLPLTSGLVAWMLMGFLAATGPLTDVWFAVVSEQKLGATGYCEGSVCTNAVFYDAPALSDQWAVFPRWGLSALLVMHGIVAGVAALIATLANLRSGLAHCRSRSRSNSRSEDAKAQASRVYATCMMCTVIAVAILWVGLLIWTSQSFAETEIGQIIWYCIPVALAIWLFSHGMNRHTEEDYHEEDEVEEESGGEG